MGLPLELKGAYFILSALFDTRNNILVDDERYIAGLLGTSLYGWRKIRTQLIEKEFISLNNGIIKNLHTNNENKPQRPIIDKPKATAPQKPKQPTQPTQPLILNLVEKPKQKPIEKNWKDDEEFIKFYTAYGKKKAPVDAYKAFCLARKEFGMDAIRAAYKYSINNDHRFTGDIQYRPFPASWLNECRRNKFDVLEADIKAPINKDEMLKQLKSLVKYCQENNQAWQDDWTQEFGMDFKQAIIYIRTNEQPPTKQVTLL